MKNLVLPAVTNEYYPVQQIKLTLFSESHSTGDGFIIIILYPRYQG